MPRCGATERGNLDGPSDRALSRDPALEDLAQEDPDLLGRIDVVAHRLPQRFDRPEPLELESADVHADRRLALTLLGSDLEQHALAVAVDLHLHHLTGSRTDIGGEACGCERRSEGGVCYKSRGDSV